MQTGGLASDKAPGKEHKGGHVVTVEQAMGRVGRDEVGKLKSSRVTRGLQSLRKNFGFYPEGEGNGL